MKTLSELSSADFATLVALARVMGSSLPDSEREAAVAQVQWDSSYAEQLADALAHGKDGAKGGKLAKHVKHLRQFAGTEKLKA